MKQLKQITILADSAAQLLNDANMSHHKWESMLRENIEMFEPYGKIGHSDETLQTQYLETRRIMRSYQVVINEIKEILCSAL